MRELTISTRGTQMPASPIRKLAPLAYAAEDEGVKIYRLNIGQPARLESRRENLPTPHSSVMLGARKALDELSKIAAKNVDGSHSTGSGQAVGSPQGRTTLEYSPSQGYRSLRKALVNYYDRYQIKLTADDIIITCGGSPLDLARGNEAVCLRFYHELSRVA